MLTRQLDPDHPFFTLDQQYHRDLMWSIYGPALLDCSWAPAIPDWLATLCPEQLKQSLQASDAPVEFRSPRLGLIFEQLWHQFLQLSDYPWQANIQIFEDQQPTKKTIGEIDLIFSTPEATHHIELALKFYLGYGDDWIGPNRKDYLAEKIRHTRDHQLTLSQHPLSQTRLAEHNWHNVASQAVMRGCLFYPASHNVSCQLPHEVSDQHWRGSWCRHKDSNTLLPDSRWYILAKPQWISPARTEFSISRARLSEHIDIHFRYLDTPICAVECAQNQQGFWCEQHRWLIMPDHWPSS